jgi:hypothetical protein
MRAAEQRLSAAGGLATFLASLTLVPLIEGTTWLVALTVIMAVLALTGIAARLRVHWWPAVATLQAAVGAVAFTILFARDEASLGVLPGPACWRVFTGLFHAGLASTHQDTSPVPSSRGLVFLVTLGLAVTALAVDTLAASLRKPAVAGLPLLAVYCVPAAVLPGGLPWWWFLLAAAGFLLLVSADGGDRVYAWGQVLGSAGEKAGERVLGGPLAGGRRLLAVCLFIAVVVPAAVPGLDEQLFSNHGDRPGEGRSGNITVINPILRIRENLNQRDDVVVMRYRTTATSPEPLRIVSDDVFDGKQWSPSVGPILRTNKVQNGLPNAPGLTSQIGTARQRTEFETFDLHQTYLPLPYPTTQVDIDGPWLFDPRTLNVVGDHVTTRNLKYTAQHLTVTPTVQELETAGPSATALVEAYGQLPANTPHMIRDTAHRVAGSGTAYQQAVALQQWLRSDGGFRYSETVLPPPRKDASSQDAVVSFLQNKQGYCVQFASTMAVMARTLGIPSRVGVGFLPGDQHPDGSWEISIRDAHAWPELYFSGVGWVRFEPTPGVRTGTAPEWTAPPNGDATEAEPSPFTSTTQQTPPTVPQNEPRAPDTPAEQDLPLWQRLLKAVPWQALLAVLVLAGVGAAPWTIDRSARWVRWRRVAHRPASDQVETAWQELRERLEDLGVRWAVSWTPRALQLRLTTDHVLGGTERAALGRLVADIEHVRYTPPGEPVRGIKELRSDVDVVVQGITMSAAVPTWTRRRARWLPASGRWQASSWSDTGQNVNGRPTHERRRSPHH